MIEGLHRRDRIVGGLLGLVVGDALGAPAEGWSRRRLREDPVTGMDRGGRQPPGTWSDDGSLALQTAAGLAERGYDPADLMERFRRWLLEGEMTPRGEAWGMGGTTVRSILGYAEDRWVEAELSTGAHGGLGEETFPVYGGQDEWDNGNGSLMRILPLGLWLAGSDDGVVIDRAAEVSALTHAHVRARLCCAYHCLVVKGIMAGRALPEAMNGAAAALDPRIPAEERPILAPILSGVILEADEDAVESSAYVAHTLGASLRCCAREGDYRAAVLRAVNLGVDADTTGAVTGGLAGVRGGVGQIPPEWIDTLAAGERVRGGLRGDGRAATLMRPRRRW